MRPGLAAEVLRGALEVRNTFVQDAAREGLVVLPSVNVRSHAVVIDVRIAPFRHPEQRVKHLLLGRGDGVQAQHDFVRVVGPCRPERLGDPGERLPGFGLDVHMD